VDCCTECEATFAELKTGPSGGRSQRLDAAQPCCRCEDASVSPHSPGCVGHGECLIRVLVAPQHVDKKGRPRAAALADAETHGLSLFRAGHIDDDLLRTVAERLVERARAAQGAKAGVVGVLVMSCETIRKPRDEVDTGPCYCVYDTALKENHAHAEAFQRVNGIPDELRDGRRRLLFQAVRSDFVPVTIFRGGILSYLAPAGLEAPKIVAG